MRRMQMYVCILICLQRLKLTQVLSVDWWQYGDINVKDAGYVKLRSLSLGYSLPSGICRQIRLNSLNLKLQVNNLFTRCKAGSDIDPESYGLNSGTRGMASPKTYSIGLSTSF